MKRNIQNADSASQSTAVEMALAKFLSMADAGEPVDTEDFVAQHPEIVAQLRPLLQTAARLEEMAGPCYPT
jgi:hypothetical protein